ncbi:MAG: sulfotransferase domain-containing protein [Gammaproteobacteria bacterium]|nr:sulfotransferase domain-containing protein [Gammaproteobacteria bacterium]
MPMGFPVQGFASGLGYRPHSSDIFVCTYPKCGTTWMQYIVYLIVSKGKPLAAGESLTDVFPHLEEVGAEAVEALPEPRLIKTHLPYRLTPQRHEAKYVCVARNPFDCAVSFFHHTRGFVRHYDFADGTFDDFFECFIAGEVDFGDYFEHLVSWYRRNEEDNVLFVTYEDMQADVERIIVEVGGFLGGAARAVTGDPRLRGLIRAESSFDSMRREQRRWSSERPAGMPDFVRKGVVGDWKSHFSAQQARRLLDAFFEKTGGEGAYHLWPEVIAEALAFSRT